MTADELRKKNPQELDSLLSDILREQFNLRMQKGTGQLSNFAQVRSNRREIARIKTLQRESMIGAKQ